MNIFALNKDKTSLSFVVAVKQAKLVEILRCHIGKCFMSFQNGNAAVHEAAWNGFSQTLDLLIKFNCNIQTTNKVRSVVLMDRGERGFSQTPYLLKFNCNIQTTNKVRRAVLTARGGGHKHWTFSSSSTVTSRPPIRYIVAVLTDGGEGEGGENGFSQTLDLLIKFNCKHPDN